MSFDFGMSDEPEERSERRALLVAVIGLIVVVLIIGLIVAGPIKHLFSHGGDYSGDGTGSVQIVVNAGDSAAAIGNTLAAAGVVKSSSAFVSAANQNSKSRNIAPGTYELHSHMRATAAVALMLRPSALVDDKVLITEGMTAKAIIKTVTSKTQISLSSLQAALDNPSALGLPAYAEAKPEGFLFPATYVVQPGETATAVLKSMVTRYDQAALDTKLAAGAARLGLSEYQVLTFASMVQAEGRLVTDFPKIAEVFLNRYHDGTTLGSDATLYYVLGHGHGQLTTSDLQNPSPYNTRLHIGLPPTPINSPGEAAIDAVLHAPKGSLLYFVTIDKAGHTAFAKTLAEFNNLVAQSKANGVS